jgi:Holliday junction resolvase RusA-like endonuclease
MTTGTTVNFGPSPDINIALDLTPVSLQGSAQSKEHIREAVRRRCERASHLLSREVSVEIEWTLYERYRWDTPGVLSTPDVDNIIKPLLDGLCGPRGILI